MANNLEKTGLELLGNLRKKFPAVREKDLRLVVRKGIYAYEYMDSLEKMKEDQLPPNEALFSMLTNSNITDAGDSHAKEVWKIFNVRKMRDYHELYMISMTEFYSPLTLSISLFGYLFPSYLPLLFNVL